MTRFMNILASVALATALTPIAANAMTMTPLGHVQVDAYRVLSGPLPEVQNIAANAATAQGLMDQTIVQSGATAQLYPDAVGG